MLHVVPGEKAADGAEEHAANDGALLRFWDARVPAALVIRGAAGRILKAERPIRSGSAVNFNVLKWVGAPTVPRLATVASGTIEPSECCTAAGAPLRAARSSANQT